MINRYRSYIQIPLTHPLGWLDLIRALLVLLGVVFAAVALAAPELRGPEGLPSPEAWLLLLGGLAIGILAVSVGTSWTRFSLLLGMCILGQAASFNLIFAPNYNVLQRHLPWETLLTTPTGLYLIGPAVQTLVGLWATWRYRMKVAWALRSVVSPVPAAVLAFVLIVISANGAFDLALYAGDLVLSVWTLAANGAALIVLTASIPQDSLTNIYSWLRRRFSGGGRSETQSLLSWDRLLPWCTALWVVVFSAAVCWLIFDRIPHVPDSVSHLFQAKYFSKGLLFLPPPPDALAFEFEKLYNDGTRWFAYGFPGWAAMLSLGVLLKVPWLVNPVLAGITVLLTHSLVSNLYNRRVAHMVILLLAVSPWFLFMSASFMSHPLTPVWTLISLVGLVKAQQSRNWRWALLAGAALGGLFLTRPQEALMVGLAIGLWVLLPRPSLSIKSMAALAVGGVLVGGLLFPYNRVVTGGYLTTPHQVMTDARYYPGADRLGFGSEVGTYGWRHLDPLPGHGLADVLINAHMNSYMSNVELFGWGFGSVVFAVLLVSWKRIRRPEWLFLLIIATVIGGHSFFWSSGGPDFGARYWYQILVPLVVLSVCGVYALAQRWRERGGTRVGALRVGAFVVMASLVALLTFVPWRALEKYPDYRGMNTDLAEMSQEYGFDHGLVFVKVAEVNDYARALVLNPPTLDSTGTVYALDLGPESRERVIAQFPGRKVWRVEAPEVAGPYLLISGPLASQ